MFKTFYAISRLNSWLKLLYILKITIIINIMEYKINKMFKNICEFNPLRAICPYFILVYYTIN